jgi:hypothetical protein
MLDNFLTITSVFDWITPTVAYIQDLLYGPASDFGIPAHAGWRRRDIKRLLNKHGIRVWGLMLNLYGDMVMFTVPKAQAEGTYSLLKREGVPILYAPAEVAHSA